MMQRFDERQQLEEAVLLPMRRTSNAYRGFILLLGVIVVFGFYAYAVQLRYGLLAIGTRDQVMYGLYIVNFVFFIGISYAGALVSAILRLTHAGWRTPITRMAELIAVGGLTDGAIQPILDMGRPDRVWHMVVWGRFQSPLLWDIIAILTYLVGSFIYLYLPLIPDFALVRDRLARGANSLKWRIYNFLAVGWQDTPEQRKRLDKSIGMASITIIPLAIGVHTVVGFIFSMTLRPGWNSTIYGIYFVIGAIFSGTAVLLIIIAIFRKVYHFEKYITERHFRNLSYIFLTLLLTYFYLSFTEYLTVGYKLENEERELLELLITGKNAPWFWTFLIGGIFIPAFLLIFGRKWGIKAIVTAAVLVTIGMWLKRFVIIIPTLEVPMMPFDFGTYSPTWVEVAMSAATLAAFTLMITAAAKFMPLLSVWEVAHEQQAEAQRNRLMAGRER